MTKAKLFMTGGSEAVRLPAEFRFEDRRSISGAIPSRGRWCFRSPPAWNGAARTSDAARPRRRDDRVGRRTFHLAAQLIGLLPNVILASSTTNPTVGSTAQHPKSATIDCQAHRLT